MAEEQCVGDLRGVVHGAAVGDGPKNLPHVGVPVEFDQFQDVLGLRVLARKKVAHAIDGCGQSPMVRRGSVGLKLLDLLRRNRHQFHVGNVAALAEQSVRLSDNQVLVGQILGGEVSLLKIGRPPACLHCRGYAVVETPGRY